EDEAVAALDEAGDALGHRPEGHQPRYSHRDAEHGEEIAARQETAQGHHSSRDSTGRPALRRLQRLTRTMAKKTPRARRPRRGAPLKVPPASTPVTLSSSPAAGRGAKNTSRNAGS